VILVPDAAFADDHALEREAAAPDELRVRRAARADEVPDADWREADAVVAYHILQYDEAVARRLERCRILVRAGVGTDNVDLAAFGARGIPVCCVPDYGTEEVADHAIGLMLALSRGIVAFHRGIAADPKAGWDWRRWPAPVRRLRGLTVLIVGMGAVGRAVAARARAFGLAVRYFDPRVAAAEGAARADDLDAALGDADIVTLHAALTDETRGLMNAARFARLKPGAILINTARGGLVDLDAVTEALRGGALGAAALDVLADEPPDPTHDLFRALSDGAPWLDGRLVVTPHAAFLSADAIRDMRVGAIATALLRLREGRLRHCVNADRLVDPR
jgi:phosphoglycerate dehydrogenase-like enzyme